MIDFLKKYKITLIVLVVGAAALVAYQVFFVNNKVTNPLVSSKGQIAGSIVGKEVIGLLEELQSISINTGFFEDPVFKSLFDLEQEVKSEEMGKNNPFVLIGSDSGPVSSLANPTENVNMLHYIVDEYIEDDLVDEIENGVTEGLLDDSTVDDSPDNIDFQ